MDDERDSPTSNLPILSCRLEENLEVRCYLETYNWAASHSSVQFEEIIKTSLLLPCWEERGKYPLTNLHLRNKSSSIRNSYIMPISSVSPHNYCISIIMMQVSLTQLHNTLGAKILWSLSTDLIWSDIPEQLPSYTSSHRISPLNPHYSITSNNNMEYFPPNIGLHPFHSLVPTFHSCKVYKYEMWGESMLSEALDELALWR